MIEGLIRRILNPQYDIEKSMFFLEMRQHKETIERLGNKNPQSLTGYERGQLEVAKTNIKALNKIGVIK